MKLIFSDHIYNLTHTSYSSKTEAILLKFLMIFFASDVCDKDEMYQISNMV